MAERGGDSSSAKIPVLIVLLVFLPLAMWVLRPQLLTSDRIHTISTDTPTVANFNVWTIGWNAEQLADGLRSYWDAPIFAPERRAFAFSEPQPATWLVAPVVWLTGSYLKGYQAWLLFSVLGNGAASLLLCHRMHLSRLTSTCVGVGMMLLPASMQRMDVIQLVPIWGILWFLSCARLLMDRPTVRCGVETGLSFAACFALCVHHAMFFSLLLLLSCAVWLPGIINRQFQRSAGIAVFVAALLVIPMLWPLFRVASEHSFDRSAELVQKLSAKPIHYLTSQPNVQVDPLSRTVPVMRRFHVGWVRMFLSLIGLTLLMKSAAERRWAIFLFLMGAFAFLLSLGLNLSIGGWQPWSTVAAWVPGFRGVRNVFRFVWFVQIVMVLFAGVALDRIWDCAGIRLRRAKKSVGCVKRPISLWQWAIAGLATAASLASSWFVAAEVWPLPTTAHYYSSPEKHAGWIDFLKREADPEQPVACLPLPGSSHLQDFEWETRWMIYGLRHQRPLVNGYSGFFPASYQRLTDLYRNANVSDELLTELLSHRVRLLVVARGTPDHRTLTNWKSETYRVQLLHTGREPVDVFEFSLK